MKKRVYVSAPLTSSGDPQENLAVAMRAAEAVFDMGAAPLVPHFSIQYDEKYTKRDHNFWMSIDLPYVATADALLRLPGESKGADAEVDFAVQSGVPVFESLPSLKVWLDRFRDVVPAEGCCQNGKPRREIEQAQEALGRYAEAKQYGYADAVKVGLLPPVEPERLIGKLRHFDTGARRCADADTTRYDLISPIGMRRLAETYAEGCGKYPPDPDTHRQNWTKGMPVSSILNHAIRHIFMYLAGDTTEDHLAHCCWNVIAAMHMEETMPEMVDIYERRKKQPGVRFCAEEELLTSAVGECAGHVA